MIRERERFDITRLKAPVVRRCTGQEGYSHPVVFCKEGTYHLFYTAAVHSGAGTRRRICTMQSSDLCWYTAPQELFAGEEGMEFFDPGGVVLFQGAYRLVFLGQDLDTGACRIYAAESSDLVSFSTPKALELPMLDRERAAVFLTADCRDPQRVWCFYQMQGLKKAWSDDLATWHCEGTVDAETTVRCAVPKGEGVVFFGDAAEKIAVLSAEGDGPVRTAHVVGLDHDRTDWAQGGVRCGSVAWDARMGLYLMFYWGYGLDDPAEGSLAIAVSRDLEHWTSFTRDQATYPENGIIYDGDYHKPLPFSEYIHKETPQGPVFDIRDYGAVPDGATLCTEAFMAAAQAARDAGGGTILVAGGHYCVGTVELYDDTTLFIAVDSALCASKDLARYQDALVACVNRENVSIRGGGKIIGNGEYFAYLPLKKPLLHPLSYTRVPPCLFDPMGYPVDTIRYAYRSRIRYAEDKYGEGLPMIRRPMYTVWIRGCAHVRIENVVIEDSLDWTLDIDHSTHVFVRDLVINGNRHVANTDGIDIMSSSHVSIEHCFISCADDGICIKAPMKQGHDGLDISDAPMPMGPAEDIHISDCTVLSVMNAFKIGTETYHDIRDVTVEDCRFMMPDIYPGSVSGISIESADGSRISNIQVRNVEMDRVCCPVFICLNMRNKFGYMDAQDREKRSYGGSIRNVRIEHVRAFNAELPSILTGFRTGEDRGDVVRRIEDIEIRDLQVVYRDNEEILDIREPVYENLFDYPESNAFGDVPAYGFYIRHARQVVLEGCRIVPRTGNTRECIVMEDVE